MAFAMLVLASFDRSSARRTIGLTTALVLILMSQSTTALTAGLVTLLIFVLLRRLAFGDLPARASYVVVSLLVVGAAWMLSATFLPAVLGLRGKDATLTGRTEIWSGVRRAIGERPWQGYGIGGVWGDPSVEPARSILRGLGFTVFHSHNGFLEILLLLGVGGLAAYVWLMVSTIRLGLVHLRADPRMSVFIVCYVVLIAVLSITEVNLFGIWLGLLCAFQSAAVRSAAESRVVRLRAPG
jgi:O-antigen ligase